MEKVKQFYEALANDAGMKERAAKLTETFGEQPDQAAANAAILAFAKAEGYDFTVEELTAYAEALPKPQAGTELNDDELNAVAGGGFDDSAPICWDLCICSIGGGGNHSGFCHSNGCTTGKHTCACVVGGGGKKCSKGTFLACAIIGVVGWE